MSQIIGVHRLGVNELKYDWTARPDPDKLLLALRQHQEVHVVGMVHHETTTGLLNPVHEIAEIVDNQNRVFVLDSVSALAGETLNIAKSHIYMVTGTAGKCIQGFPGVSFVLVRKGFVEKMRAYPKRSWYLHLIHYIDSEGRGTIPFTPAVQVYYAFDEALSELLEEGVALLSAKFPPRYSHIEGTTLKAVILAGGYGTRISEESAIRPKPMVEIGGKPVLWHIMKIYSSHGINESVICCGYKGYMIKEYFAKYWLHMSDLTFDMSKNEMKVHQNHVEPWKVTVIDTGEKTMTGGRLKRVKGYLGDETFCMTYGDGVSDINIGKLVEFHRNHKTLATLTAVPPPWRRCWRACKAKTRWRIRNR